MDLSSYASQTTILQLPAEILFEIMKMAGCLVRYKGCDVRLVCKQFYEIYCERTSCGIMWNDSKLCDTIFASMMNSSRRPFRMEIRKLEECSESTHLRQVIDRFGICVQKLEFNMYHKVINITDYDFIMRSMVNITEVSIRCLNIIDPGLGNELKSIELPQLKKLSVFNYHKNRNQSMAIVLRMNASSLKEFRVHNESNFDFTQFFQSHQSIKRLTMCQMPEQSNPFNHLQLTHLQISKYSNLSHLRDVIDHQPKLRFLNLLCEDYDDDHDEYDEWCNCAKAVEATSVNAEVFTSICNLKELETLKMVVPKISIDALKPSLAFGSLKELVMKAENIYGSPSYGNENDDDFDRILQDVIYQKIFRKLITIPMPALESFTWSLKDWDTYDYEEVMEVARRTEYSVLGGKVNVFEAMAKCFPNLKFLKIKMKTSSDIFNIQRLLQLFPHLQKIDFNLNCEFEGRLTRYHEHIKHIKVPKVGKHALIELMNMTPNLKSLLISAKYFPLNTIFLAQFQAAMPNSLKNLSIKLKSFNRNDFGVVKVLQEIVKKLQSCRVKIVGDCNFNYLSKKIDRSIDTGIQVYVPSASDYYLGGDWGNRNHKSYMELWKGSRRSYMSRMELREGGYYF